MARVTRAQVGSFDVGVDVDDRLNIVMADRALFHARHDAGKIRQHLHRPGSARRSRGGGSACAGPTLPKGEAPGAAVEVLPEGWVIAASVAELVMGRLSSAAMAVHAVLRRLNGDVVGNAVAGIEIEVGAGLEAAAEGHQQALRHILLRQAHVLGAGAVHVHCQVGIIEGLLDARVGGAGNIADLIQHALGEGAVAVEIGADDLNIDGRGETKIQDLR